MAWVKLDDQFFANPKVIDLPKDAKLLYLGGLTHAAAQLTDGALTPGAVRLIAAMVDVDRSHAAALVTAGLWDVDGDNYIIHDYHSYNRTAEQVKADRDANAKRQDRYRGRHSNEGNAVTDTVTTEDVTPLVQPTRTHTPSVSHSETEPELSAPVADVPDLDLTDGEREVVQHIRAVRGLASVSEGEVALHLREILAARDGPSLSRAALRLDAIRFRDHWQAKRANAPPNQRWRGWKNAVTKWFSQTYELKANGKAPETIPDRDAHREKHLTRYHFDNAPERAAS